MEDRRSRLQMGKYSFRKSLLNKIISKTSPKYYPHENVFNRDQTYSSYISDTKSCLCVGTSYDKQASKQVVILTLNARNM